MGKITQEQVLQALQEVFDPEVPFNVVDLGLIYGVEISDGKVKIKMTLTTIGCPLSYFLVDMVREAVREKIPEVEDVEVELVFDPPWTPDRMKPEVRKLLGL
ncbi:MAG: metal-sulfur cluster assembly factor [Thermofilum sp.]|jgi:metal-sulfur cluster biosynthetic enzyme|nr:metal-sulfur cluster assembly factor [Thermofilum sp.]